MVRSISNARVVKKLKEAQNIVERRDVTWAKALKTMFDHGELSQFEWERLFMLCYRVARPGLHTNLVIPTVISYFDVQMELKGTRK